jgi:CubicO group peptidase (beta-lactamase class C family)
VGLSRVVAAMSPKEEIMDLAAPGSAGMSAARLARIAPAMQRLVDRGEVAGVVTWLARHGKVVHCAAVGALDREADRPMTPEAIFRIYSMTKPITTVAVMQLYEEGYFGLDDPIAAYIPAFADTRVYAGPSGNGVALAKLARPITFRHLLTHTAGLSYGFSPTDPVDRLYQQAQILRSDESLQEKMPRLADLPLAFQPGSAWNYSVSIDVLGALVEVISGLPFDQFLAQRLFAPLGMTDTAFYLPPAKQGRLAAVYTPADGGGLQRFTVHGMGQVDEPAAFLSGGGGLASTAADYGRFAQMLLQGGALDGTRILSRKTVELLSTSQTPSEQIPVVPPTWAFREGYGMALGVRTLVDLAQSGEVGSVGTYTWQGAAGTDFWVDPQEDLCGICLVQILPGQYHPAEVFRRLVYAALED